MQRPRFAKPQLIRNYDPKKKSIISQKMGTVAASSEKWLTSPLTGEKIRADKMEEHVRYGLIDPTYSQQKKDQILKSQLSGGIFAEDSSIAASLESLASRRTDIFGIEETAIGKKVQDSNKDKEKQEAAMATWDGHAGSAELVTARAKKTSSNIEFKEKRKI